MPAAIKTDWGAIAAQAAAGATLEQLSEHWGIALGTLKDRCAAGGWKAMAREVAENGGLVKNERSIQPSPTNKAVTLMPMLGDRSKVRSARIGDSMLRTIQKKTGDDQLREVPRYAQVVDTLATVHGWNQAQPTTNNVTVQLLNQVQIPDSKG